MKVNQFGLGGSRSALSQRSFFEIIIGIYKHCVKKRDFIYYFVCRLDEGSRMNIEVLDIF